MERHLGSACRRRQLHMDNIGAVGEELSGIATGLMAPPRGAIGQLPK